MTGINELKIIIFVLYYLIVVICIYVIHLRVGPYIAFILGT